MNQPVLELKGNDFFRDMQGIYVNRNEESFETPYHTHDFIEIAYVAEGRGFHHLGRDVYAVEKGDLFVLPVGVEHVFRPESAVQNRKLIVYNCLFRESLLQELVRLCGWDPQIELPFLSAQEPGRMESASGTGGQRPSWHVMRDSDGTLIPLFQALFHEFNSRPPAHTAMLTSLLMQMLINIYRGLSNEKPAPGQSHDLTSVFAYIREHLRDEIKLADLAKLCRLSERHFARVFKQATGQTVSSYILSARIAKSCDLLRSTAMKIEAVADSVGYRDLDSFYRAFRRIEGVTPGQYRKRKRRQGAER